MGLDDFVKDKIKSLNRSDEHSEIKNKYTSIIDDDSIYDTISESEYQFYDDTETDDTKFYKELAKSGEYSRQTYAAATSRRFIEIFEDNIKYYLPIFTIIRPEREFKYSHRYTLIYMSEEHSTEWDNTTVTCLGSFETEIHNLIKDSIMFNAGTTNKQKLNEYMSDMFVEDVCELDTCHVHLMGSTLMMRDIAQANEVMKNDSSKQPNGVLTDIIDPNPHGADINED